MKLKRVGDELVRVLQHGDSFGEMAFMFFGGKRSTTVVARKHCSVWVCDSGTCGPSSGIRRDRFVARDDVFNELVCFIGSRGSFHSASFKRILSLKNASLFFSSESASLSAKEDSFAKWCIILASFRVKPASL